MKGSVTCLAEENDFNKTKVHEDYSIFEVNNVGSPKFEKFLNVSLHTTSAGYMKGGIEDLK